MGIDKFLARSRRSSAASFTRVPEEALAPRPAFDRLAHIGVHAQKQPGLNWIGVVLPVGKLTCEQMRGLAKIARDLGDGDIRLTVWQNLLISGVRDDKVALATAAIEATRPCDQGVAHPRRARSPAPATPAASSRPPTPSATPPRSRDWCEPRVDDRHADQHPSHRLPSFLRAALHRRYRPARRAKVAVGEDDDTVEGYHILPAAASGRRPRSGRRSIATSRPRMRRRRSSGCSRPISRIAPRPTRPS